MIAVICDMTHKSISRRPIDDWIYFNRKLCTKGLRRKREKRVNKYVQKWQETSDDGAARTIIIVP